MCTYMHTNYYYYFNRTEPNSVIKKHILMCMCLCVYTHAHTPMADLYHLITENDSYTSLISNDSQGFSISYKA